MEQTEHSVEFHILDCGIAKATKRKLSQYITIYPNATLIFHTIDIHEFATFPVPHHFSSAMYSRFYIADLVPDIHKALYIDVDTCIVGNIAEIFNYDLEEYGLGAVSGDSDNIYTPPALWIQKHKEELMMKPNEYYFCSGMLLINCQYWREHTIKDQCLKLMNSYSSLLTHPDQDVLNIIFRSNYKPLPLYTHCFTSIPLHTYRQYIQQHINNSQCTVIHYSSGKKPWNSIEDEPFLSEFWWKYAKLTPFYQDFLLDILDLRSKQILQITRYIYRKSLYTKILIYIKYKISRGEKRKQYKKLYHILKSL